MTAAFSTRRHQLPDAGYYVDKHAHCSRGEFTMAHAATGGARKATNVTLPVDVYERARSLGINFSRTCEQALREAIQAEEGRRWAEEHAEFIRHTNQWVEENGLPLAQYRMF
ncbi:type II toxin-antitoxin system CcdA family antitoxin [Paraburkholderia sp. 32]